MIVKLLIVAFFLILIAVIRVMLVVVGIVPENTNTIFMLLFCALVIVMASA